MSDSADSVESPGGQVVTIRCRARTALAGNPSDGYGGAVLSVPIDSRAATVTISEPTDGDSYHITQSAGSSYTYSSWADLRQAAVEATLAHDAALILATIATLAAGGPLPPMAITMDTTIPRSVGLAGSSAIVIATLRALAIHAGVPAIVPERLASIALNVERDGLGIAAGLQDRVVQAFGTPMMMRFGAADMRQIDGLPIGRYEQIDPIHASWISDHLFVAHRSDIESSDIVHQPLRARYERGEPRVLQAMADLATFAEQAAAALAVGSAGDLGVALDGSFDTRASIVDLDPRHVEMVEVARHAGAHVNYTGSGGAVVVLGMDAQIVRSARTALVAIGCTIVDL